MMSIDDRSARIAVVYYSATGNVHAIAAALALGASETGAEVRLRRVAEYDERRGSDLLGTLSAYFAAGGSPSRAAATLHVHVNTVAQRLERVAALLGADWQSPDRALEIQLALRLRQLRAASGPTSGR